MISWPRTANASLVPLNSVRQTSRAIHARTGIVSCSVSLDPAARGGFNSSGGFFSDQISDRFEPKGIRMRRHARLAALAVATATMIGVAVPTAGAGVRHGAILPRHLFAPYFETYDTSAGAWRRCPGVRRQVPVAGLPADRPGRLLHCVLGRRLDPADRAVAASAATSRRSSEAAGTSSRRSAATRLTRPAPSSPTAARACPRSPRSSRA